MYVKHLGQVSWGLSTCCGQALGTWGEQGRAGPQSWERRQGGSQTSNCCRLCPRVWWGPLS